MKVAPNEVRWRRRHAAHVVYFVISIFAATTAPQTSRDFSFRNKLRLSASSTRNLMAADSSQRKRFFKNLDAALWRRGGDGEAATTTFATGGQIAPNRDGTLILSSLDVEGVGELRLPATSDDIGRLLGVCEQAPYGHGLATVVNVDVRCAWQVDVSKVTFPQSPDFVTRVIGKLASRAVRALGLDGSALQVEPRLYKLLLYEAGGHFNAHRDTEKEPGMFATMVVQLPTERGFEGGALVVRHNGARKTFDFSVNSSTGIFYAALYADCEHELHRVVSGQRLCLVFNLVRGNSFDMELGELKGFSAHLARVELALRPWEGYHDAILPEKLAIPLEHKYTKKNLSFAGLKGVDRAVAGVLKHCRDALTGRPWLDLHLCIFTLHKKGTGEVRDSYSSRDGSSDEDDYGQYRMDDVLEEGESCDNWVDINNKPCRFDEGIDTDLEVVMDHDEYETPFNTEAKPDEVDYEGFMGNYGPTLQEWYHTVMLVIWPKDNSMAMAWQGGVSGVLDLLETRAAEEDPHTVTLLRDHVLSECERSPRTMLDSDLVASRLLNHCLAVGAWEDVVRMLELLGRACGIRGGATVTAIAGVVKRYGWVKCGELVTNILSKEQAVAHGRYFPELTLELQKVGCEDAALLVAKRTLELIYVPCSSFNTLKAEVIASMGKMIFCISNCTDEVGGPFVERLVELGTERLCWLLVQIYAALSEEVLSSTQVVLLKRIFQIITTRNFHRPAVAQVHVANLMRPSFHLGDEQLFTNLVQALLDQSRVYKEQHILKEVLGSDEVWRDLSGTSFGSSKLQLLAEERIPMIAQPSPPFTWCMPFAKFPPSSSGSFSKHSAVEAFLRGPKERLEYTGVSDLKHAINFAHKYFDDRYVSGYSAIAALGLRSEVCVVITKTRTAFKHNLEFWRRERQTELSRLRQLLGRLRQAAAAVTNGPGRSGGGNMEEAICLSPDRSNEREKRRRVSTTEYIDLSRR